MAAKQLAAVRMFIQWAVTEPLSLRSPGWKPERSGSPQALPPMRKVSRPGERPGPTVTVRMEEDNVSKPLLHERRGLVRPSDE